jgi:hypothetical protein
MQPLDRLTFTMAPAYMCQTQTELRFGLSATSFGRFGHPRQTEQALTYLGLSADARQSPIASSKVSSCAKGLGVACGPKTMTLNPARTKGGRTKADDVLIALPTTS